MINGSVINGVVINGEAGAAGVVVEDVLETAPITNPEPLLADYLLVSETAVIVGDYVPPHSRASFLRDAAVVTNTFDILRTAKLTLRDPAVVTDATYLHVIKTQDVTDSAVVTSTADAPATGNVLTESAVVTSSPTVAVTKRLVVRDRFRGFGDAVPAGSVAIRDTFVGTTTAYPLVTQRVVVRDSAVVTGTTDEGGAGNRIVDVTDTAVALGYASNQLQARDVYRETGFISDRLVSTDGLLGGDGVSADSVWTASMASWGMSRHTGAGITQRGTRFAVSPAGLYEVGPGYSPAEIDTGFMDLGTKALKHVSTVYFQGERDGDLTVTVTADRRGVRAANTYLPLGRAQDKSRTIRVEIGRGYRSTFYKMQVNTTNRAEIFGGEVLVAPTERRI